VSSFRFVVVSENSATVTKWQDQTPPTGGQPDGAARAIGQIRSANPDATIYTEHNNADAKDLNPPDNGDTAS
jgi:hypothetical protein